jgi:hypothetical protein
MKNKTTYSMCAAVIALVLSTVSSFAGETVKPSKKTIPGLTSAGTSGISGELGVDIISGYMFRGSLLDSNLAYQPSLSLSIPFDASGLGAESAALQFNTSQAFNQNGSNNGWFRSEVDIGVSVKRAGFTLTPSYQLFNSPTSQFQSAQGVNVKLEFDDSTLTKLPALKPYVSVFKGTQGNAANGTDTGLYYEVGVAPSTKIGTTTFALPVAAGFGARNYYAQDQRHGFTSVGLTATTPITQNLNFNAGVKYWSTTGALNTGDSKDMVCTSVGLALTF